MGNTYVTYESALKEIATKIDILNNEFIKIHNYNPIEHVTSRIKSSESIVKKLKRHGLEVNMDNMQNCLSDIAGIRIVCSFTSDIYRIADRISSQSDIQVLTVKIISQIQSQMVIRATIWLYRFQYICQLDRLA